MAWFNEVFRFDNTTLRIGHCSDCHLFAHPNDEYFNVNTAYNFSRTLAAMAKESFDAVIFGGDLTQDHSLESYQLFARLVAESELACPVFWLPGNHDDIDSLHCISQGQIKSHKRLTGPFGQVLLLNSKGPTPAGWCEASHLQEIVECGDKPGIAFVHHHPVPIAGYLDKHILENGPQLVNCLVDNTQIQALFHGHVHHEYQLSLRGFDIFATPATSIQFAKNTLQWQQQNLGPAFRVIELSPQSLTTEVKWLDA